MAAVTRVRALDHVATMLGEDLGMLEAIIDTDDNLSYGAIVSVQIATDEWIAALTDEGIDELKQMLAQARQSQDSWENFLQDFVSDPEIIARVKQEFSR